MTLTIYGRHTSYNVQKVLWYADELGLDYNWIDFGSQPEDTESAEFGRINPMRKVPVLIDDDKVIWESNSILRYLARCHGNDQWLPENPFRVSLIERWMDWAQTKFEPAFVGVFWGYYRCPASMRDMAAVENSLKDCQYCLDKINDQLEGHDYLIEDRMTLADICVAVFLHRLVNIGLDITLPGRVLNWFRLLEKSTAYRKWVMSDFSMLRGRLQY